MTYHAEPVAFVKNSRAQPIDDNWNTIVSEIILAPHIPAEALTGIEAFSHIEVIFHFDKADENAIVFSGKPRGNPAYPLTGIFAQRKKDRPNHLGICCAELIAHEGNKLIVRGLDAIDGTPVLDIKPVFRAFLPKGNIRQAEWVADLMKNYW